jgi:hypothetical protein
MSKTNHNVGAVEDQGEEKCETAKVHIALRVELSGLNFHAFRAKDCLSALELSVLLSTYTEICNYPEL